MFTQDKKTNRHLIQRKNEKELNVTLQLGTGKLHLNGETDDLMDASFTVKGDSIEPDVQYDITESEQGKMFIQQRSVNSWKNLMSSKQEWSVALNRELPLSLKLELGAGKSNLNLSKLNLTELNIEAGIGETEIDLTGEWIESFKVKIDTGVGKMKLRLPKDIGAKINIDTGIGKVNADYFMVVGDSYQNQAYDGAEVKLDIDLNVGVGEVIIEQV